MPVVEPRALATSSRATGGWRVGTRRSIGEEHGLGVAVDTPFAGTYVPLDRYRTDDRVTAVMLEIRRDTYLDEATAAPHEGERDIAAFVDAVVAAVAAHHRKSAVR